MKEGMNRFINYILSLNGHVTINDSDITAVVPNKFSQHELFDFVSKIELYNFYADCGISISYNKELSDQNEIVLSGFVCS